MLHPCVVMMIDLISLPFFWFWATLDSFFADIAQYYYVYVRFGEGTKDLLHL